MNNKIALFLRSGFFGYLLLTIILLGGFLVRLYKINSPVADWHSWRQADTAAVSRIYIEKGINLLYPKYYDISSAQSGIFNPQGIRFVEFPIYNLINVIIYRGVPTISLEVWARLITISSAVITAFFLYLIGRKYLGLWGGILSAFFYLFIPYNIYFTRVILPDPFGTMCGVMSLWFFSKFIENDKNLNFYLSAVLMAVAFLIKPFFVFYLVPVAYLAIKKFGLKEIIKNKRLWLEIGIYGAIILVPFLLWRVWEARHPEAIPLYTWAFNSDGIRFRPSFWRWIFQERLGQLILGGWGLVFFIFGILKPKQNYLFINYFIIGMLLYVTIVATANVRHDYYQIITIPAIALVIASGFVYLWENKIFSRFAARIIAVFSVFMMLMTGWLLVRDDYNINHPEIIAAGKEIQRVVPKDALVVAPYDGDTAFLYQTDRSGWPVIDNSIDNIIKEGAGFYVSVNLDSSDTKMIEARFKTIEKTDQFIIINLREPI